MNSVWIIVLFLVLFAGAYKLYGDYIAIKIFKVKKENLMPSEEFRDDIDYMPTNKEVLFGHHFASIAGTGPIVGPAIAIIWGWVPALIWIVLGAIFAGAVHDFASLIISVRKKGNSIAELTQELINPRVKMIFFTVVFFLLWLVVAIFGLVIAIIFKMYPQSVFPIWFQIPLAVTIGWLAYKKKMKLSLLSVVAVIFMYGSILIGMMFPVHMPSFFGLEPVSIWVIILLLYAFVASVLPVWTLLQPRDYINSHQLVIGIVLLVAGVFFSHPIIVAPAVQVFPAGAPPIIPFLFITITCGAISGFHSLVSSGTTSKQLRNEKDAKFICFGGMLIEGLFAVLVIIAVAAGIGIRSVASNGEILNGVAAWQYHYSSWVAMKGLSAKITAFVSGSANMLEAIGIPFRFGCAVIGVLVASFAGTTLDTATRIQRYVLTEMSRGTKIKAMENRYLATAIVVSMAMMLAFSQGGGKGALSLWPLFGAGNQILAGVTLLVAFVYLKRIKSNVLPVFFPMVIMICVSVWATVYNIVVFIDGGKWLLFAIGSLVFLLELWMIIEILVTIKRGVRKAMS